MGVGRDAVAILHVESSIFSNTGRASAHFTHTHTHTTRGTHFILQNFCDARKKKKNHFFNKQQARRKANITATDTAIITGITVLLVSLQCVD